MTGWRRRISASSDRENARPTPVCRYLGKLAEPDVVVNPVTGAAAAVAPVLAAVLTGIYIRHVCSGQ
jgi:hypothetical protein